MSEVSTISSDYAVILPHNRDKGGMGYVIFPHPNHAHLLTTDDMHLILRIYEELLKRKEVKK